MTFARNSSQINTSKNQSKGLFSPENKVFEMKSEDNNTQSKKIKV